MDVIAQDIKGQSFILDKSDKLGLIWKCRLTRKYERIKLEETHRNWLKYKSYRKKYRCTKVLSQQLQQLPVCDGNRKVELASKSDSLANDNVAIWFD
jgi:hypothetical protein